MAVNLDDDVPLILTLDEGGSGPLAPSNGLGQEELPSRSKMVGWGGRVGWQLQGVSSGLGGLRGDTCTQMPDSVFDPQDLTQTSGKL